MISLNCTHTDRELASREPLAEAFVEQPEVVALLHGLETGVDIKWRHKGVLLQKGACCWIGTKFRLNKGQSCGRHNRLR